MFIQDPTGAIAGEDAAEQAAQQTPAPRENRLSGAARKRQEEQRLVLFQKQRRIERRSPPPEQSRVSRGRQGADWTAGQRAAGDEEA
jgi:hypothetical protein